MCGGLLGFVLVAALPGALRAQTPDRATPVLSGGYFFMERESYPDGASLSYSCDTGKKPVAELWWATVRWENGQWSHEPQCIDETSCVPPIIPHAKYTGSQSGWYEDDQTISVSCDDGYGLKRRTSTARCRRGSWSPLPVCEKQIDACDMPPKISNAVVIDQEPREVFASGSEVQYECREGFRAGGGHVRKTIVCRGGVWTEGPSCHPACVLTSARNVDLPSAVYMTEGEERYFPCIWTNFISLVKCINGRITAKECCRRDDSNCLYQ